MAGAPTLPMQQIEEATRTGSFFGPPDDLFQLGEELGSGAAARVHTCSRLKTGEQLAVKVINVQKLRLLGDFESHMVKLDREVSILQDLSHPRIVNLHAVHRTAETIFLVMELVRGGELFDQIVQHKCLKEGEAKFIFRQLLEGVGYMHAKHVIHRDLKPENILIASTRDGEPPLEGKFHEIKIADFGLSKVISEGSSLATTFVGTPQYWAPEVLNVQRSGGSYNQAADFWSLGAVLFVMLCGRYPFDGKKMPLEEQIRTAAFTMNQAAWQKVSEEGKDMVRGLLRINPNERLGIEGCLRHPWLAGSKAIIAKPPPAPPMIVTEVSAGVAATTSKAPIVTEGQSVSSNGHDSEGTMDVDQALPDEQPKKASSDASQKPGSAAAAARVDVPAVATSSVTVGDPRMQTGTYEETIFCLNELLKLQVSIAGSLEMASLAFRHTNVELSDAIRQTFRQARDLFSHAANVVSQYATVAQQVSRSVLADLKLAVDEKEPALAMSLLGMVKDWVSKMKKDGEEIQHRYMHLQESVNDLIVRAKHAKMDADRRLGEAVQHVAEAEMRPPAGEQLVAIPAVVSTRNGVEAAPAETLTAGRASAADGSAAEGRVSLPLSITPWTRQLLEKLKQATEDAKAGGADKMVGDGTGAIEPPHDQMDVLMEAVDLILMAPGIAPQHVARAAPPGPAAQLREAEEEVVTARAQSYYGSDGTGDRRPAASVVDGDTPMTDAADAPEPGAGGGGGGGSDEKIVPYGFFPMGMDTSVAEAVTHTSTPLIRALRELKRVDEILQGCSAFWANMDGTVQKLAQMKEHTECLVNFAANSKALKQRFDERLNDYDAFWSSLEKVCRQYCIDHQTASKTMYEKIREMSDRADVIDTTRCATVGMVLGMREKQRRQGYA